MITKLPTQVERVYIDPRMVEEISRDPRMLAEQGGSSQFMSDWGGPEVYKAMASMPSEMRMTYASFLRGADTVTSVKDMTGLDEPIILDSISFLESKGYMPSGSIINDGG